MIIGANSWQKYENYVRFDRYKAHRHSEDGLSSIRSFGNKGCRNLDIQRRLSSSRNYSLGRKSSGLVSNKSLLDSRHLKKSLKINHSFFTQNNDKKTPMNFKKSLKINHSFFSQNNDTKTPVNYPFLPANKSLSPKAALSIKLPSVYSDKAKFDLHFDSKQDASKKLIRSDIGLIKSKHNSSAANLSEAQNSEKTAYLVENTNNLLKNSSDIINSVIANQETQTEVHIPSLKPSKHLQKLVAKCINYVDLNPPTINLEITTHINSKKRRYWSKRGSIPTHN